MTRHLAVLISASLCCSAMAAEPADLFALSGYVSEELGYSYQHQDFRWSKLSSTANLALDGYFTPSWTARLELQGSYDAAYDLEGAQHFTAATLAQYRSDLRINEAYTDIDLNSGLNLRLGRQYFGWGESNSEQISDIGNPRDLRVLGLQNVRDIRLPVGASKLTWYDSAWEYSLIAIHEIRHDELGAAGAEFDPFLALRRVGTVTQADKPSDSLRNTGVLSRLFVTRDWGDISVFAGRQFEGFPLVRLRGFEQQQPSFSTEYFRVTTVGLFGNVTQGSVQLKYELARKLNRPHALIPAEPVAVAVAGAAEPLPVAEHNVLKSMLGLEYSGFSDTQLSVEYIVNYIESYQPLIREPRFASKVSVWLAQTFLNGQLTCSVWANHLVQDNANLFRLDLAYNYDDAVTYFASLSGIDGAKRDSYYQDYGRVDRLALGVKVAF